MPRKIKVDGQVIVVPDDATDEEINQLAGPSQGQAPASPVGTLSAAPAPSWLDKAEEDLREGGSRTGLGRILGKMQGRDNGYTGIESGVSKGAADFLGSPELGSMHAIQSASTIPQHPVKGVLGTIGGILEASSIPGAMVGGPGATAAIEAIPSTKYAGKMLGSILEDAKDVPVSLTRTLQPLERTQQLTSAGAPAVGVADKLYQRINTINPLTYGEGRDFYSNITNQSVADKLAMNGPMKTAMGGLREAFKADLGDAAGVVGRGEDYAKAMKEYAQAAKLKEGLKTAGKLALGAAGLGGAIEGYSKLKSMF